MVFPNPGDAVTYGGKWLGKKPTGADTQAPGCSSDHLKGRLITLKSNGKPLAASPKPSSVASANVGDTEDESQTGGHGEDEEQGPIVPKAKAGIDTIPPGSDANQADTPAPASEQKVPSPAPVPPTDVCKGGIKCSPDGKAFSVCGLSGWIPMGEAFLPGSVSQLPLKYLGPLRLCRSWYAMPRRCNWLCGRYSRWRPVTYNCNLLARSGQMR